MAKVSQKEIYKNWTLSDNMPEHFKLLCLALVLALVSGEVMDFLALTTSQTFAESEDRCRTLGYDGLAVVSSPEMYRYALRLTEILR